MQLNMSERKGKRGRVKVKGKDHRAGYYGIYLSLWRESAIFSPDFFYFWKFVKIRLNLNNIRANYNLKWYSIDIFYKIDRRGKLNYDKCNFWRKN